MPGTRCTLALDQGGHASRALVFDPSGKLLAQAERRVLTYRQGGDRVEHRADAMLRSVREAAEAAIRALPRHSVIQAAALATQRSSAACWDRRNGKPLSPVISWQDRRAARRVAALSTHAARVRRLTGLVLSPHYGATKLAWCLRNLPQVRDALRQRRLAAGPLASYLVAGLLPDHPCVADPVNGARTQLLDIRWGDWSAELCELFGVPLEVLPACVPNRHDYGVLKLAGHSIPLTVVTGDQPAALFAQGEPKPDVAYANVGTGAFVQCLSEREVPGLLHSVLWRDAAGPLYALEGTVNGAGAALEAVAARRGLKMDRVTRALPGWLDTKEDPPLFLNGVGGLGAPFWRPRLRSRFIGSGDDGQRLVAVVESIVFLLHANLQRMQRAGIAVQSVQLSGGLARFDGLCQRLADLAGLPVERPELHEATALGLARLAGGITGSQPSPASRFVPRPNAAFLARARRWRKALRDALD